MTGAGSEEPAGADTLPEAPSRPPGGRVFSLEDRPAPGLYFLAWALSIGGAVCLFIGSLAQPGASALLVAVGLALLGSGLAAAAGYSVLARRDRHPSAYQGPSPILVFGVVLVLSLGGGLVLGAAGLLGSDLQGGLRPTTFLLSLVLVAVAYVVAVHFLVVRTGALSWTQMSGMTGAMTLRRVLNDIGFAALITLPVVFGALVFGSLIGLLLQVEAPQQVPFPRTSVEALLIALGAAVVAPVGEELFFRGFALSAWQRDLGIRAALIRSSVFFAIVHIANVDALTFGEGVRQALLSLAVIAPIGFLLGWLFQQRGIVASIAGHVTYNATLILLLFVVTQALGSPQA